MIPEAYKVRGIRGSNDKQDSFYTIEGMPGLYRIGDGQKTRAVCDGEVIWLVKDNEATDAIKDAVIIKERIVYENAPFRVNPNPHWPDVRGPFNM